MLKEAGSHIQKGREYMRKTAVILPGIGYNADKPLLYYSAKLAKAEGYEIVRIGYHDLPEGIFGDKDRLSNAIDIVYKQAMEEIASIKADEFIFLSKSIGTVAAARVAKHMDAPFKQVYFTPLEETIDEMEPNIGIAFHGTADPWAKTEVISVGCKEKRIPLYVTENANHSLETGDIVADIKTLKDVMEVVADYLMVLGRVR